MEQLVHLVQVELMEPSLALLEHQVLMEHLEKVVHLVQAVWEVMEHQVFLELLG